MLRMLFASLLLTLSGCAATPPAGVAPTPVEARTSVPILISIDGFRPDYLDRGVTPILSRLAAEGVRASMRPSFPTKTYPNHWTLVTGIRPDRHGIVGNAMFDPARPGEKFTMASDDPFWWNAAEPVWVAAEKAGIRTGVMFWPGSSVAIGGTRAPQWPYQVSGGTRPSAWQAYSDFVSADQRVDAVIDWLRRPPATRPRFATLYFQEVDTVGHLHGPDDPRTTRAIADVDAAIGRLLRELAALGQPADLVIVSDHGMTAIAPERSIALDKLVDPAAIRVAEDGTYAALAAVAGREAEVETKLLGRHGAMECWRKGELPARFHYGRNPRVQPIFCLADSGWRILRPGATPSSNGGDHGYDPETPDMASLFVAHGPAFHGGRTLAPFDNVDVAPLLRALIGLPQAANADGSVGTFRGALRN